MDRLHQRDVVDDARGMRQQLAVDPAATLPALLELEFRRRNRKPGLAAGHGGDALITSHARRDVFVEEVVQLRLVVPEVDLRRAAVGVDVDDALRPRGVVREARQRRMHAGDGRWIDRSGAGPAFQEGERRGPQAHARGLQKRTPRGGRAHEVHRRSVTGHGVVLHGARLSSE